VWDFVGLHDEDLELGAVIGIPCNSDFGTSNKIGTEEGMWSDVLIFGHGMDTKNVGVILVPSS
jgi:hypothetical protein